MKENAFNSIGSFVDEIFLLPGRLIGYFQSQRAMDWHSFTQEVAFYHEQGYVKNPSSFFTMPERASEFSIVKQTDWHSGYYQEICFSSRYEPRNPLIRKRYQSYVENRTGYLIRWIHGDRSRKTVLCVHGFMMGAPREAERMFKIRKLFSMGLDVALFIQPFHWKRIAGPRSARRIYLALGDTPFTNECVGHSVYDLHNVNLILNKLGVDEIGIVGASLGGYITGIYACVTDQPKFAAMMVPALSLIRPLSPDFFYKRSGFGESWQAGVRQAAEFHSALNLQPKIPPDNILVVASQG